MKNYLKIVSAILVITMGLTVFPVQTFAQESENSTPKAQYTEEKEPKIIGEIVEKRERNVKHFLKDDMTYEAAVYPSPIHYLENGKWEDVDNTLADDKDEDGEDILHNKKNDYKIKFAKKTKSKKLVKIQKENYEIVWNVEGVEDSTASTVAENKSYSINKKDDDIRNLKKVTSKVEYKDIFPYIDLEYQVKPEELKENIVINQKSEINKFIYNIETKKLTAKLLEDNSVVFYDEKDQSKEVFKIDPPFMFDANLEESRDIKVVLEESKKGYTLSIIPNEEWIEKSDRKYPITIDPIVRTSPNIKDILDNHVSSANSKQNFVNDQYLKVGYGSSIGTTRSYLKFTIPKLQSADLVTSAYLYLIPYLTHGIQINAHKVLGDWDTNKITWENQPKFDTKIEDYQITSGKSYYQWDVTNIVKEWYNTGNNTGLMLQAQNETSGSGTPEHFYSSDIGIVEYRPVVVIGYVNNAGLENYWTYHSQDAGRAGCGYINDYNGSLVFVHNDLSMNGNRMPVMINHVFNSSERNVDMGYGQGWRLNLSQTVKYESIDNTPYYIYTDEDGTKHFFKFDSSKNIYIDEAGTNYTLTVNGSGSTRKIVIKDKEDNKLTFGNSTLLETIEDRNKNTITLRYDSNKKLIEVVDGAGRKAKLNVEASGRLKSITDPSGREVKYEYADNKLKTITYPDNKSSVYEYDSAKNLINAINYDGYKMIYSYYDKLASGDKNVQSYRIKKVQEAHTNGTLGGELNISYGRNSTTFTDYSGRKSIYQFNNIGNTICIKDPDGSAQYYKYFEDGNVTKNKLKNESKLQKTVLNLLKNHNVEANTDWNLNSSSGSTGSGSFTKEDKNIGKQSLKITKTNEPGNHYFSQTVSLKKDKDKEKVYTLSAYVKADGVLSNKKGAGVFVYYNDGNSTKNFEPFLYVTGNTPWQRVEAKFTIPKGEGNITINAAAGIAEGTGSAYFDNLQLEEGPVASRYNLVENPSFEDGLGNPSLAYWNKNSVCDGNDKIKPTGVFGGNSFSINGVHGKNKCITQNINVSGKKGDTFVVSGWAKGDSIPLSPGSGRHFALDIGINQTDGITKWVVVPFCEDSSDWQYVSNVVTTEADYSSITYYAIYYENANTAYFDGLQLYKEDFEQSYKYDDDGNLQKVSDIAKKESTFKYKNNDLIETINPKGNSFSYKYDDKHNIKNATSSENVVYSFEYDPNGNPKTARVGGNALFIKSTAEYTPDGNYLKEVKDSEGNIVKYNTDSTKGTLNSVIDPKGQETKYTYDGNTDKLLSVQKNADGKTIKNSYTYKNDNIESVTHNGFSYNFAYDSLGNNTEVYVGNQRLIKNTYEPRTSRLLQSEYGNGQNASYDYDILDRIIGRRYNGELKYEYQYDGSGNLGYHKDNVNQKEYRYIYDISDRLMQVIESKGDEINYSYDLSNNIDNITEKIGNSNYVTGYGFSKDGRATDTIYKRPKLNDGKIEYFPFNVDTNGSKGTKDKEQTAVFERDENFKPTLAAFDGTKNLIQSNSSFENQTTGWTTWDWSGLTGKWRIIQDGVNGKECIGCYDSDGKVDGSITNSVAYQYVTLSAPLTSPKEYTLSAYAKRIGSSMPVLSIQCLDSNDKGLPYAYWTYTKDIQENQWTKIAETATLPAGTKKVMVMVRSNVKDNDVVRFDSVQFEEKPFASPYTEGSSTGNKIIYNNGIDKASGTMGVWFKTYGNNTVRHIIANEGANRQIFNLYIGSDNKLCLAARKETDEFINVIKSDNTVLPNTWYFAAFKWQQSGTTLNCTIYLNDKSYTASITNIKDFTKGTTAVGSSITGYQQLNGHLEQFMYSSYTLSDTDIKAIYNEGKGTNVNNAYDSIGRLTEREINARDGKFDTKYQYLMGEGGATSNKLKSITNKGKSISYEYDKEGNITKIILEDGNTIDYKYNELNEVIREDNKQINKTIKYSYDEGGNILSKIEYPYTTGDVGTPSRTYTYDYTDANWKDKLISYDGKTITYDNIGNPLTYNGYTFTWEQGRQLKTIAGNGNNISYKYNDSGIRTEKTVNGKTTKYHLVGDKVTQEVSGIDTIYYTYDAEQNLVSMNLNGSEYYYIRNGQGDIIGLSDDGGRQVVSYTYDTWGKLVNIDGPLASRVGEKNPYRYRGYGYDSETGLYYLQSRYYNPEFCRMLNVDAIGGFVGELLSHNVFAYCQNDPINHADPSGFARIRIMDSSENCSYEWGEKAYSDGGTAGNITVNYAINTKTQPPRETGYKPPKNPDKGKRRAPAPGARGETGWLDKKGNVWVPDVDMDGGEGWRRHYPNGSHDHVYPNGKVRSHDIIDGHSSQSSKALTYLAIGGYAAWTVVKWGGAVILVPETGGASLGGAALLP